MTDYAMTYKTENVSDNIDFPDGTGPRVGAFETLRIELAPVVFNSAGPLAPETVFLELDVYGTDLEGKPVEFRSLPPARIGGA